MADAACCFTGHRVIPAGKVPALYSQLIHEIDLLAAAGYTDFYAGGALGFDTLAAQAVLQAKEYQPALRLHLVLPCPAQHLRWHSSQRHTYQMILAQADSVTYAAEEYSQQAIWQRNRMLVDSSSFCLCYLIRAKGGTAYTVRYAHRQGIFLKNLADSTAEDNFAGDTQTKISSI